MIFAKNARLELLGSCQVLATVLCTLRYGIRPILTVSERICSPPAPHLPEEKTRARALPAPVSPNTLNLPASLPGESRDPRRFPTCRLTAPNSSWHRLSPDAGRQLLLITCTCWCACGAFVRLPRKRSTWAGIFVWSSLYAQRQPVPLASC